MVSDPIWDTFHNVRVIGAEASRLWAAIKSGLENPNGLFRDCEQVDEGDCWDEGGWVCLSTWAAYKLRLRGTRRRFALTLLTSFHSPREVGGGWPHAGKAKLITAYTPVTKDYWEFGSDYGLIGSDFGLDGNGIAEGCDKHKNSNLWVWKEGRSEDLRETAWLFATALGAICSPQDLEREVFKPVSLVISGSSEKVAFKEARNVLK